MTPRLVCLALLAMSAGTSGAAQERQIRIAVTVAAPPERAWSLWTTEEGVRSFFAPAAGRIDLRVDGFYELFFMPSAPEGTRGADGMRLLAVEPNRRLAFTWNAPPEMPYVRQQRTMVTVDFEPVGNDSTRVTLRHIGWGTGPEWDEAIQYFETAWNAYVMPFFKHRVERGPVNWASPPALPPIQQKAIEVLAARTR